MSEKNKHRDKNRKLVMDMEVGLLLEDCERWWDAIGRDKLKNRQFSGTMKEQQAALDATDPIHPNYLGGKSGIMLGYPWFLLSTDERYRVLKAYTLTLARDKDDVSKEYHNAKP